MILRTVAVALAALTATASVAAAEIRVTDAYARSASPTGASGAAFMVIENTGAEDDRLVSARSDAAQMVGLHTHLHENGMMAMRPAEDGFDLPAGGSHALSRGGDHVMFMGLTAPWQDGDSVPVTLVFEAAGEIEIEIPVDNDRAP